MDEKDPTELLAIKFRERREMGWDEVNDAIAGAPVCEPKQQVVKILVYPKCKDCGRTGTCSLCHKRGVKHCLGYPVYDENYSEEVFTKDFYKGWSGKRPTPVSPPPPTDAMSPKAGPTGY